MSSDVLKQKIEFVKGVGPQKASLLNSEIGIYNLFDMLHYFPFRYEDRSDIKKLSEVNNENLEGVFYLQVISKKTVRKFKNKSLKVKVKDSTGYGELVWVKGTEWVDDKMIVGKKYLRLFETIKICLFSGNSSKVFNKAFCAFTFIK